MPEPQYTQESRPSITPDRIQSDLQALVLDGVVYEFSIKENGSDKVLRLPVRYKLITEPGIVKIDISYANSTTSERPLGYISCAVLEDSTSVRNVKKSIDDASLPLAFYGNVRGLMTTAQILLNEYLVHLGKVELRTKIKKTNTDSILSRLRAKKPDGSYYRTTLNPVPNDTFNYEVVTNYTQTMNRNEVDHLTLQIAGPHKTRT